jgi:4-hydroxybenzoate polyprenyltransferase
MVLTKYTLITSVSGYGNLGEHRMLYLSLIVLLITAAGYIINDILDIETDKINKPTKLYVSKSISIKNAWRVYWAFTSIACFLSLLYATEFIHFILFFGVPILLYVYSKYLKKTPLLGNILISFLVILPIYTIYLFEFVPQKTTIPIFDRPINNAILFYIFFAFITTLIRELIKDVEDIKGDYSRGMKTLPIIIGIHRTSKVILFFSSVLLVAVLLVIFEFLKGEYVFSMYSFLFILIPLLLFIYKLRVAKTKKDFSFLSNLIKLIMFFGILSMLLFKFLKFN